MSLLMVSTVSGRWLAILFLPPDKELLLSLFPPIEIVRVLSPLQGMPIVQNPIRSHPLTLVRNTAGRIRKINLTRVPIFVQLLFGRVDNRANFHDVLFVFVLVEARPQHDGLDAQLNDVVVKRFQIAHRTLVQRLDLLLVRFQLQWDLDGLANEQC
uniref:Uncharacterized protein n=1 Tax=Cacopsylla melanoneura TaxID=428564 RepID=A0A8D8UE16_9HEMI